MEEIWIFHFNPGKFLLDLEVGCVRSIFFFIFSNNDFLYFDASKLWITMFKIFDIGIKSIQFRLLEALNSLIFLNQDILQNFNKKLIL